MTSSSKFIAQVFGLFSFLSFVFINYAEAAPSERLLRAARVVRDFKKSGILHEVRQVQRMENLLLQRPPSIWVKLPIRELPPSFEILDFNHIIPDEQLTNRKILARFVRTGQLEGSFGNPWVWGDSESLRKLLLKPGESRVFVADVMPTSDPNFLKFSFRFHSRPGLDNGLHRTIIRANKNHLGIAGAGEIEATILQVGEQTHPGFKLNMKSATFAESVPVLDVGTQQAMSVGSLGVEVTNDYTRVVKRVMEGLAPGLIVQPTFQ